MGYKCKHCGWKKDSGSFHMTREDMNEIFEHEKTKCPKKTRKKYDGTY